jgi:hypothetical protein
MKFKTILKMNCTGDVGGLFRSEEEDGAHAPETKSIILKYIILK